MEHFGFKVVEIVFECFDARAQSAFDGVGKVLDEGYFSPRDFVDVLNIFDVVAGIEGVFDEFADCESLHRVVNFG